VNESAKVPRSLSAAMLLQFAVGGAFLPFVSLILRDRGLTIQQISIIFSCASVTVLIVPFFWGMLADRYIPLDRLFVLLNLIAAGALVLFCFQHTFAGLLATYLLFFVCFNPLFSLINALAFHHLHDPPNQFGKLRAWGSIGWILPFLPISLWVAVSHNVSLNVAIYLSIAAAVIMAVLAFWLPHTPPTHSHERALYKGALRELLRNRNFLVLLAAMFLVSGSFTVLSYYSPPLLEDLGVPRAWIGPVQAIGVLFEVLLFQFQPAFTRRWTYMGVILAGCIALVVRQVLFATITNTWVLSFSYLLAGAVIVFFNMGVSVLTNALVGREIRATAQTLLSLFGQGLGATFCNAAAGGLSAHYNGRLEPIFWFAAVLALIATLLIASRGRKLNPA
jgi:MFS transporter, PPP family, 3-phenylpropionic acid transporter